MALSAPGLNVPKPPESVTEGISQNGNNRNGGPDQVTTSSSSTGSMTATNATPTTATTTNTTSLSSTASSAAPLTTAAIALSSTQQVSTPINFEERLVLKPYSFDSGNKPPVLLPAEVIQLWIEVGNGIDKSQTVVWKSAVDSLDLGIKYLDVSADARHFVQSYAGPIIGILVEQQPGKIGVHERNCVQESLTLSCLLTIKDLSIQLERGFFGECALLNTTLAHVFNKKKAFYKINKGTWNVNQHQVGLPEVRLRNIERFRLEGGFKLLIQYLEDKVAYQQYYNSKVSQYGGTSRVPASLVPPATLFPKLDPMHQILQALCDSINSRINSVSASTTQQVTSPNPNLTIINQTVSDVGTVVTGGIPPPPADKTREDDAVAIAAAVMKYLHNATEDELKKIPTDQLSTIVKHDLQRIFDKLIATRRHDTYQFYSFWRALILKLISSKSLPLKLFGWEQVSELIEACADHAPPPRQYLVQGAGCTFANGIYHYAGQTTPDGYAKHGSDILYSLTIPPGEAPTKASAVSLPNAGENPSEAPSSAIGVSSRRSAGKKLTLFRCTMRSQQKWWFLSEADEQQPGTDRDIDYYQHKSKEHEESLPPRTGWITSRSAGMNPPPTLEPQGLMVPHGKEYETLEHLLAKWAIENEIVEGVLGDSTIHREIVARSTVLIKFLASMCSKDDNVTQMNSSASMGSSAADDMKIHDNTEKTPNKYCLQSSHLLFAWKTCTRKADAAVSSQVYQLLVQILPSCPSSLAIPLLKAIQSSLQDRSEKHDYLNEVAEFCSALASSSLVENINNASTNKNTSTCSTAVGNGTGPISAGTIALKEDVREEVLNLLWSVLTYPGASSLKSYDTLKRYVTHELRVEPAGCEHRKRFLQSCVQFLMQSVEQHARGGPVDEMQALRMVKLTKFILEACPRTQACKIVSDQSGKLALLLYDELKWYMHRRKTLLNSISISGSGLRKTPMISSSSSLSIPSVQVSPLDSNQQHDVSLNERLMILRYVYGLSGNESCNGKTVVDEIPTAPLAVTNIPSVTLTVPMLENLWTLCESPDDKEALMFFIASASTGGKSINSEPSVPGVQTTQPLQTSEHVLSAAFSDDVCHTIFLNLFCSVSSSYEQLGESGYRSFQFLFKQLRDSPTSSSEARKVALDALWRVCISGGKSTVASRAMKDLLSVYVSLQSKENGVDQMLTDDSGEDSFCDRMLRCVEKVKSDLYNNIPSAELSAERCMRILNAAIGQPTQNEAIEGLTTSSTLARLSLLDSNTACLDDVLRCLPHGVRGQACYRRIGVIAKRPQVQNNQNQQNYENVNNPRMPTTTKFSLDVHALETLLSLKCKVAAYCQCSTTAVKPIQVNGRARGSSGNDLSHLSLNVVPEDSVMDELGIAQSCEVIFVIAERAMPNNTNVQPQSAIVNERARVNQMAKDLSSVFFSNDNGFSDRIFSMLLEITQALSWQSYMNDKIMVDSDVEASVSTCSISQSTITYKLVWDLLLAMPTNVSVLNRIKGAQQNTFIGDTTSVASYDAMEVEVSTSGGEVWSQLLDEQSFDRSVYVLLTIDSLLQPAVEVFSTILPLAFRQTLETKLTDEAVLFRRAFIDGGGFNAVVRFFAASGCEKERKTLVRTRRAKAVALRILKSCLFGPSSMNSEVPSTPVDGGTQLLQTLSDVGGLLKSLTSMVVDDKGISSSTVSDVLRFLRLLFSTPHAVTSFVILPDAEKFLFILLMWEDDRESTVRTSTSINAALLVRRGAHDLILQTPELAHYARPWLMNAITTISVQVDSTFEYFDVMERLISESNKSLSLGAMNEFAIVLCMKLSSCPRPTNESDPGELSTGVLCGCLKLLRALIEIGVGKSLREGVNILLRELRTERWSEISKSCVRLRLNLNLTDDDETMVDLVGVLFDGFLSPSGISGTSMSMPVVAICCDKESRRRGFDAVGAAAKACQSEACYLALFDRIGGLIDIAAPRIRNRWGQMSSNGNGENNHSRSRGGSAKFSGLRNQGCTCYMNSVLQQLIMMPELRDSMCSATLPTSLRSVGSGVSSKSAQLVGKRISLQWETGVSYDAVVKSFDETTGMHTIVYLPIQIASVGGAHQQQFHPDDVSRLPPCLPDEFILLEGRPGKETGVFEVLPDPSDKEANNEQKVTENLSKIKETEDEAASRRLLEEFQRTFIHLKVGSKGRCFDPRALVEACSCLKLEFDVWQQNDASEFATKLLDRLEISLKKWAPDHFRYMDHTFGLKQTKQKICRKCGMKSNREEKLLTIDCQIRGKSDIHEALSAMTEVEIMEGSNRVYCDNCKENTDTILKSAISTLPNMLILSLKRFDLDFTTFETVKLNSRCAFGQSLNMKQYTLEGLETLERGSADDQEGGDPKPMETEDSNNEKSSQQMLANFPDEDYEYNLVGVLVHAGVAQGGHYYSFIKDRNPGSEDKWYRFDDEDVTPFDPASIEVECFGGKVKKETKWPNGQVHQVEQEQFANALMLFYEKVKPSEVDLNEKESLSALDPSIAALPTTSGYDVFEPDVMRSNANHQRQSFLYDTEFQSFLHDMLDIYRADAKGEHEIAAQNSNSASQRDMVVQVLLSYVFDILFYSADCSNISEWSRALEEILTNDKMISVAFVRKLASKSKEVSSNWLRTYLLDCIDQSVRLSSVHIFVAAIRSCVDSERESKELELWTQAWKEQLSVVNSSRADRTHEFRDMPMSLTSRWAELENVERIGAGASTIGIIVSQLNIYLEAMPRCWRFSSELCIFIRLLTSVTTSGQDFIIRRCMIEAYIPARLIALAVRDRLPKVLRESFPGASVSPEVANTQMRAESNSSHVLPMTGNQVLDINNSRNPGSADVSVILEAVVCFMGLPGAVHAPLVRETEDLVRGRQRYILCEAAMKALSTVFHESCIPGNPGMGQREIEAYLRRCGVDTGSGSTQKILEMLSKYPTTGGTDPKGGTYLSLEGFLAYYRDCVQSNDIRLRHDLHSFGFRPDLTRRSRDARFFLLDERETHRSQPASVGCDVAEILKEKPADVGAMANFALSTAVYLYSMAYNVSEPLMEYLVAGAMYKKDTESLTNRTLLAIYSASSDWHGNEQVAGLTILLHVVVSIPGDDQDIRIGRIMLSNVNLPRNPDFGAGLLQVLRGLHRIRQTHSFNHDLSFTFGRYMHIIKELYNCYPIFKWMNDHRSNWSFIERDLIDSWNASVNQNQSRNDYSARENDSLTPVDQNTHSDSDMAGINDSEDDEDSQFDGPDNAEINESVSPSVKQGPPRLTVDGAGNAAVNGTYTRDNAFEDAGHYVREGTWNGETHKYHIFLCNVSNNTKHWYISIVPRDCNPGTSSDIDFYTAPMTASSKYLAPLSGWVKAQEGKDPPPRISFPQGDDEEDGANGAYSESFGRSNIVEDDTANV